MHHENLRRSGESQKEPDAYKKIINRKSPKSKKGNGQPNSGSSRDSKIKPSKCIPSYIITKLSKVKDKETILKTARYM